MMTMLGAMQDPFLPLPDLSPGPAADAVNITALVEEENAWLLNEIYRVNASRDEKDEEITSLKAMAQVLNESASRYIAQLFEQDAKISNLEDKCFALEQQLADKAVLLKLQLIPYARWIGNDGVLIQNDSDKTITFTLYEEATSNSHNALKLFAPLPQQISSYEVEAKTLMLGDKYLHGDWGNGISCDSILKASADILKAEMNGAMMPSPKALLEGKGEKLTLSPRTAPHLTTYAQNCQAIGGNRLGKTAAMQHAALLTAILEYRSLASTATLSR